MKTKDLNIFVYETIIHFTEKLLRKVKAVVKTVKKYFVDYAFSVISGVKGMIVTTNSPPLGVTVKYVEGQILSIKPEKWSKIRSEGVDEIIISNPTPIHCSGHSIYWFYKEEDYWVLGCASNYTQDIISEFLFISIVDVDRNKYDDWVTYIIDSTYFPNANERLKDGTYKYWKRDSKGRFQTAVIIRPRTEYMRHLILSDTSTFTPHPGGEIPYWFTIRNE